MNMTAFRSAAKVASQFVYLGAGIYMIFAVFSYFHEWELPLWQWIAALVVAPITFVAMPVYVGFTEGDWSLVAVWIAALAVVALSAFISD